MGTRAARQAWQARGRRRRSESRDGASLQSVTLQRTEGTRSERLRRISGSPGDNTPVSAVMTCKALCVRKDHSIEALAALLVTHRISGVPVVDAEGRPIGVVSKTDLVRERHENGDTAALEVAHGTSSIEDGFHELPVSRGTVADVMTPVAISLHEHSSVSCAAALMAMEGLHRVVVVGDDDRVTGIVTALDIMRWVAVNDSYLKPRISVVQDREAD